MACTWVAANTAQSSRPCGFSRASLTLVLGPHLFHMQLNEIHSITLHYITLHAFRVVKGAWVGWGRKWVAPPTQLFADAAGKSLVQPLPRLTVYGAPVLPASLHHCHHRHCHHRHCHHHHCLHLHHSCFHLHCLHHRLDLEVASWTHCRTQAKGPCHPLRQSPSSQVCWRKHLHHRCAPA